MAVELMDAVDPMLRPVSSGLGRSRKSLRPELASGLAVLAKLHLHPAKAELSFFVDDLGRVTTRGLHAR